VRKPTLVIVGLALLLSACGPQEVSPIDDIGDHQDDDHRADLSGRLEGDPQLEGGCVWLRQDAGDRPFPDDIDHEQVEPLWPDGYRIDFDPLRLLGPDGEVVAEEGQTIHVDGEVRHDMVTICQVGPVFEITRIIAVE
jgi:hypothetical protein